MGSEYSLIDKALSQEVASTWQFVRISAGYWNIIYNIITTVNIQVIGIERDVILNSIDVAFICVVRFGREAVVLLFRAKVKRLPSNDASSDSIFFA